MSTIWLHALILRNNFNYLPTYSIYDIHMVISSKIYIDHQVYLIEIELLISGIPTQPSGIGHYVCPSVETK